MFGLPAGLFRRKPAGGALARRMAHRGDDHQIAGMKTLELSDEEEAVLAVELVQLISQAEYFSDRVHTLGAILNKLASERAQEPLSAPTRRSLN
jgi:hypothetical protein